MDNLIKKLETGLSLNASEVAEASGALLSEDVSAEIKADFLETLHKKGETPEEIGHFVEEFLARAVRPKLDTTHGPLIDVCGTGGDGRNLFNVSTTSMFVIAAGGATIVKHGNRGITSKSGGADVLEALGVRIDLGPEDFTRSVAETGAGFLFAPLYHPAFKAVVPVRQLLAKRGQRSVFNILGPLLNPVRPDFQLVGVFDGPLTPVFANILQRLGRECAWAVHGKTEAGHPVDELSTMGANTVSIAGVGGISDVDLDAREAGLKRAVEEDLRGGDATQNAGILTAILDGSDRGAKRDMVVLNAGAALAVCGLADDWKAGCQRAAELIDGGQAMAKLRAMQEFSATIPAAE